MEFRDTDFGNELYLYLIFIIPLAILLTLTGTLRNKNSSNKNWGIGALTVLSAITAFIAMFSLLTQVAWGSWTNKTILYRNNKDNSISINEQIWDIGALGYDRDRQRIVELKPVFNYLYKVTLIDTLTLNKKYWTFVGEEGDIHFP